MALLEHEDFKFEQGPLLIGDMLETEPVYEFLNTLGITLETERADRGIVMPDYDMIHPDEYAGPYWRREKLKELFPEQMGDTDVEDFYHAINRVTPSLVRIEADELTYALHIMVRYEIEKQLIGGTLEVKDVPAAWNKLYAEYLGVQVPDDARGCLQDIHWSGGSLGYFPSYALGSAYGAQMIAVMQQELGDVYADVARGDLSRITGWLREHIHQHANFKKPGQILEEACGKFDAKYYTDYLTKKYSELYNL